MRPKSHRRHSAAFRSFRFLLFLVSVAVLPRAASARIINVPANQPTLQAATAAAANGDTILFAPGTYTGGVWIENKSVVVASRFLTTGDTTYIAQTVLTGTVANVCNGVSSCTGDAVLEYGSHADGSAVIGLTLTGAVKGVRTSSRTDVDHCHAMGMILAGDGVNYLPGSSGTISNSLFANNRDDGIDLNGDVSVTVVNNIVQDNSDDGIEFRMYPYAGPTLTVTITGNRFLRNGADGIQLIDSPDSSHRVVRIERNLFHGNQKATVGCMPNQQTNEDYSGTPLGEHVVFVNNTVVGDFYGVCGGANSVVVNNIFTGITNSALRRVGGNSICAYNVLWSNGLNYETSNMDLPHTLLADPRLDANDRLTTGSPAIDYGTASYLWRGITILNLPPTSYSGAGPDLGVFEFGGPAPTNAAPVVSAGTDQTITLPADAVLDGTVTDDGEPNPPGTLATAWSIASGPGPVTFQNPSAVDTRATFTISGTYLLRLTANDGALSSSATVQVTVQAQAGTITVDRRVAAGTDDAEESATGVFNYSSSDLELVYDGSNQWVGLRFTNVTIPRGAAISGAYIQFQAKETQSEVTSLTIRGQAADNPAAFSMSNAVSTRPRTTASATWMPAAWTVLNEAGVNQRTVDLSPVIQEIVNRPGWAIGNSVVILINGTGHRTAWGYEGLPASAPLLHIESGSAPPPPTNTAPVVSAGPAQTVTLPADAILDGTVTDDGLPNPPGAFTTTWSMVTGPAAVTFQNASAVDTRATFPTAGTYVLRLTAADGGLSNFATIQITVQPAPVGTATIERRIATGTDDAEESGTTTSLQLSSFDIEMAFDIDNNQWVGLRFTNITIPRGTVINSAYLQFEADEAQSEATSLVIRGQAADNPGTFSFTDKVASRPRTTASASWAPAPWTLVGEAGSNQRSTDLSAVVQEIVNRPGWVSGNAMVMVVSGTGHRTARAFDALPAGAALLHIETGTPPVNAAPVVDAGPSQSITLPADAILDGTVSDDGLPNPPGALTTTWSMTSGPAAVTFQNANAVDTRAIFSAAGTYVLRLTAADGALSTSATVQITVAPQPPPPNTAPVVDAGPSQSITLPADAALDGTVSDDGLPNPPGALTTNWSLVSGPASVAFLNSSAVDTRVVFTAAGTYLLRLTAGDGALAASDSVQVTVAPVPPPPPVNAAPVVDAGPTRTVTLPFDAMLDGTVSDDGLPGPPPNLVTTWSVISGPGAVTFQDATAVDTHASFVSTGTYLLRLTASDGELAAADSVLITVQVDAAPNAAPVVSAGPDQVVLLLSFATLDATVSDDGLPGPPATPMALWSRVSGPGTVTFQNATLVDTRASFAATGTYILRLTYNDGALATSDSIRITVVPPGTPNAAPVVNAGANQTITLPADAVLDATVSDDGLPNPPATLTTTWSAVSGPGSVVFQNAAAVDTRATFTVAGTYVLRLTAADGALSTSATVEVTVQPAPPANTAPVVSAGPAQSITLPADAILDGTVSDDGLPNPPGALTTTWSMTSGPAAVTFQNANAVDTRATFTAAGTYVLRLTAADGALSTSATVQVTVQPAPPANTAPVVSAGPAQSITLPADAILDGTVSDDGLPNPPGALTTTWSMTSGPAAVTFQNANAVDTRATFTAAGTYVLRLTAADGALSTSATVQITVAPQPPPPNTAPVVDAGPAQTITLPADAILDGTVSDDGLPNPPGALTTTWSMTSGPAAVTFQNANAVDTRATFTAAGTYVLRLTAADGALSTSATVQITVAPASIPATTVDRRIATGTDDAEESATGSLTLTSSDIELVFDINTNQWVGLRFPGIAIPRGAEISRAYVQFQTDEVQNEPTNLVLHAEAADNPGTFSFTSKVSTRARTAASATWTPVPWNVIGEAGPNQRTSDLSALIQEVVNRPGWASGNAIVIVVSGTGHRTAQAFEGLAAGAALLHIEAGNGPPPPPPTNAAPVVDAPAQSVTLPADAILDATVSDDGLPNPPGALTTTWSMTSGPAAVTFQNANAVDTRATFTAAGTYVLRLTAADGELNTSATVQITVAPQPPPPNTAPVVSAGPAQSITLPADAILDGTVSDDGLPNPPGALTTTWSMTSGPAAVTFQNANAVDTRATFTAAGTYVLRLTAADGALSTSATVQITVAPQPPPPNTAPVVDAGPAQTITLPADAILDGTVSDDGLPNPPGALTTTWSMTSGPAAVTFQNANAVDTRATFTAAGTYVLRLTAADGALSTSATVQITVAPQPPPPNTAPVVDAGPAQTITLPADAILDGTVSDDGLPNPPGALTTTWSMTSGPAAVTFQNANAVDTRAIFSAAGTYVLRLTAADGALSTSATVQITVAPQPPPPNTAPVVDAGPAQTITLPADAILDGTVSDDGLPNPPAALTTTWALASGPAAVTFQSTSAVDTRATFTAAGTYWLRLTASDGGLSTRDSVQITVGPAPVTVERRVATSSDDAEEAANGKLRFNGTDLQLVNDGTDQQVGMRFTGLAVPSAATITRAWIQFEATSAQTAATSLAIRGEAVNNAVTFSNANKVSTRSRTTASASWVPVAWSVVGEAGPNQRTPDLSAVVQEIVNRPGWSSGNAMVLLITGTGRRTAWSFDGKAAGAPLLHVEYSTGPPAAPSASVPAVETAYTPAAPRSDFAIHRLSPNPSRGPLRVEFSLADAGPAHIEVLDVSGRRVAESDLGSPGPGRHVFELRQPLPPGLYAVRLVQGRQSRFMKAIVVR